MIHGGILKFAGLLALATACLGCSGGAPAPAQPDNNSTSQQADPPPKQVAVEAAPEQVVSVFLDALCGGDRSTTASLLTHKAREETTKAELVVDPPAAPGAKFQVAQAQILPDNPNGAHVRATWSETAGDQTITNEIIWVLRRQTEGWRIAGMAVEILPGRGPEFLNFEDPTDMMKKHEQAIAIAQAEQAKLQAAQPFDPASGAPGVAPPVGPDGQPLFNTNPPGVAPPPLSAAPNFQQPQPGTQPIEPAPPAFVQPSFQPVAPPTAGNPPANQLR